MLREIVERLRVVGLERKRALEAEPALVELQHLLQDDAEIVPGGGEVGRERDRPPPGLFALDEEPSLPAHLGEIAEIDCGRARRLTGLTQMSDGEVEVAVRVGHEPEELHCVRLARPDREHPPAGHLGLVRAAGAPRGAGALNRRGDIDRGRCGDGRNCHASRPFSAGRPRRSRPDVLTLAADYWAGSRETQQRPWAASAARAAPGYWRRPQFVEGESLDFPPLRLGFSFPVSRGSGTVASPPRSPT